MDARAWHHPKMLDEWPEFVPTLVAQGILALLVPCLPMLVSEQVGMETLVYSFAAELDEALL